MLDSLKKMLWLGAAVSVCFTALILTLEQCRHFDMAQQKLVPFVQGQRVSVVSTFGRVAEGLHKAVRYKGMHILYGLREWAGEGVEVTVDSKQIPYYGEPVYEPGGNGDRDLRLALSVLDLQGDYRARCYYDHQERLYKLAFIKI
ncbi:MULTISPECIES: hypothetical protein [Paenibacillus]|uniref:hypothetical protein n=1 Tax=Paenibacillus TaxID=44249 RepID=UPI002FE3BE18